MFRQWLAALCLGVWTISGAAATLFGVVSERAAPLAAEAARQHLAQAPADRIVLRTSTQLMAASGAQLARWLREADAVLAVATFGDPARKLAGALPATLRPRTTLIAFNGEASLSLMSHTPAGSLHGVAPATLRGLVADPPEAAALSAIAAQPGARQWLAARRSWQAGGSENVALLFRHLLRGTLDRMPPPRPEPALRLRVDGRERAAEAGSGLPAGPALVVMDLANADPAPADALCAESRRRGLPCVAVLTRWGQDSAHAVADLRRLIAPAKPAALVVLQDFVIGGAEGRAAVTEALGELGVPVFKALRVTERSPLQWRLSPDGLPPDSVQYRVALPELQGSGQPIVVAAAGRPAIDRLTGVALRPPALLATEIGRLVARAVRWQRLAAVSNRDKKVALIYYNHPPGRQNIGADNLDVPASLLEILRALKGAGYTVGELPATPEALLERIMAHGVNLPEDRGALRELARSVDGVSLPAYARWFAQLPPRVRDEVSDGPLGRLHAEVLEAEAAGERALARARVDETLKALRHLVEGSAAARRDAALAGLDALRAGYATCLADAPARACARVAPLKDRLLALQLPGLRGWGAAPGKVMVEGERLLVPGLRFGNVFIGPQPPRGWEVDEELLHANTAIPPPHQYLAFYHWLRDHFRADAVVHLGRHSTYEFLPGKAVGLPADDYPSLIASDLPGIYPYIVDGVGEGIQAKRRGLAVMVDHLTPPLATTPLYDELLALRQVVESYEAANSDTLKARAAQTMRAQVDALNLRRELEASMADVLAVRGIGFAQADDQLLAHEIGHYLTKLQEKFMPHGLHVFGKPWTREALELMLGSMRIAGTDDGDVARRLAASPDHEMASLLGALAGGFVPPGKGNDPLRSPEALPTGRNFHAVDGDLLPTRLGFRVAGELAAQAIERAARSGDAEGSEAVILWASDAVRDEGVMVGFTLHLLGAEPVWNARGIVSDVRLSDGAPRRDVLVTTSGLFRDLYPNLLRLIDRAGRLALADSANAIAAARPDLDEALAAAIAPLVDGQRGAAPLSPLARAWIARVDALRGQGQELADAGRGAALRIFGDAPGAYGAGVNRLAERSGAWRERQQIGRAYRLRIGHGYGLAASGEAAHAAFDVALGQVHRAYHGRASNLYGLLDNNDAFDYLGGLSLAVESTTGRRVDSLVLQHADPGKPRVEPLASALLGELRGRYLNPAWIEPLMAHGYAGARTMGQEFLENLWGWQVTRPDLIENWTWDAVKATYFDDQRQLGLPEFLARGANAHVKAQMLAIFMVAAEKGFWQTDPATIRQMGGELAQLVARNGLPGSGHTAPEHPMWAWLAPQLSPADAAALGAVLARARGEDRSPLPAAPARPANAWSAAGALTPTPATDAARPPPSPPAARAYELITPAPARARTPSTWLLALLPALFLGGLWQGRRAN